MQWFEKSIFTLSHTHYNLQALHICFCLKTNSSTNFLDVCHLATLSGGSVKWHGDKKELRIHVDIGTTLYVCVHCTCMQLQTFADRLAIDL